MSKNVLIQLRPLDYYFFGGEETFNSGAKGVTNYHVKSNLLPQQTGLLGCLRHAMFEAGYEIGESFNGINQNFGCVRKISPLFLTEENGDVLLMAPSNINHAELIIGVGFPKKGKIFCNGEWKDNTVEAAGYDAKKGNGGWWINISNGEMKNAKNLFTKKDHIGINKDKQLKNQAADGGFYKQEFVALSPGISFAIVAELDDKVDIEKLPRQLSFGGEKRTFHLSYNTDAVNWQTFQEKAQNIFGTYTGSNCCIILLSDTYVEKPDELYAAINYGIIDEIPFRNIITPKTVTNFAPLSSQESKVSLYKNNRVTYLFKKGSVLYFNKEKATSVKDLVSNPVFESIGYNQYLIFNN